MKRDKIEKIAAIGLLGFLVTLFVIENFHQIFGYPYRVDFRTLLGNGTTDPFHIGLEDGKLDLYNASNGCGINGTLTCVQFYNLGFQQGCLSQIPNAKGDGHC